MKIFIPLILIAILFVNCKVDDDCEGLIGMPPPLFISIEVLDELTEENIFTNETYRRSQLSVVDVATGNSIGFPFNGDVIEISIGGESKNYTLNIADEIIFNLFVDIEITEGACYSYPIIKEIRIDNIEHEIIGESIKIFY